MRSPGSAQLALDDAGTMVNCTVKSEGKKEPCHEAPQGSATAAEPQPGDPARVPQDGADPQAPAQVPSTLLGAPGIAAPWRAVGPQNPRDQEAPRLLLEARRSWTSTEI